MKIRPLGPALFLSIAALFLTIASARADVHTVRVLEFYTQCNDGRNDVQYIELRSIGSQFFRQCASIEVKRTVGGANIFFAKPVFVGHSNDEVFAQPRTFLIATPAFQAVTGIVPDLVMPNGTLPVAGGVIRFAADSGCEPNTNWGTIHEVRYGDQGTAPAPGPHQAANFNTTTMVFTLGARSPRNFANVTTSNWTCDAVNPNVTVLAPNGGEIWLVGTQQNITWSATDNGVISGITIQYSTDGGANFLPVSSGEANDGAYTWTIPNTPSTQAMVKVLATDIAGNSGQDLSDALFTILGTPPPDTTAPSVHVIRPNGGETFIEGNHEQIQWTATDDVGVTSVDIDYSTDDGGSYKPVATGESNDGAYDWTVPVDPAAGTVRIRVTAYDSAAHSGSDESDSGFSIENISSVPFLPPVITRALVLQNRPNPFHPGTFIGFALPDAGPVRIEVYSLSGRRVKTLANETARSGYSEVYWDGRDESGEALPSGVYFYRFDSGNVHEVRRMILSK